MSKPGYMTTRRRLKRMIKERGIKEGTVSLNIAQQMDEKADVGMVIRLAGARLTIVR